MAGEGCGPGSDGAATSLKLSCGLPNVISRYIRGEGSSKPTKMIRTICILLSRFLSVSVIFHVRYFLYTAGCTGNTSI